MWTFSGPEVEVSKHSPLHPLYFLKVGIHNNELIIAKVSHCVEVSNQMTKSFCYITVLGSWKMDSHCVWDIAQHGLRQPTYHK